MKGLLWLHVFCCVAVGEGAAATRARPQTRSLRAGGETAEPGERHGGGSLQEQLDGRYGPEQRSGLMETPCARFSVSNDLTWHFTPNSLCVCSITGQSRTYYTLSVSRLSTRGPSAGTAPTLISPSSQSGEVIIHKEITSCELNLDFYLLAPAQESN